MALPLWSRAGAFRAGAEIAKGRLRAMFSRISFSMAHRLRKTGSSRLEFHRLSALEKHICLKTIYPRRRPTGGRSHGRTNSL